MIEKLQQNWRSFERGHEKLARLLYEICCFFVFSMSVTVLQYVVFTYMPYLLGEKLAATKWDLFPIDLELFGVRYTWSLLGYPVLYDAAGKVAIGGGLGYFISYEVGSFVAQCVNFPLQRNLTFKSKGNVWFQASGYLIAWAVISVICNGCNNLWMPIAAKYLSPAIYNILVTMLTGGVSMVIFFFVFKIIFRKEEAQET